MKREIFARIALITAVCAAPAATGCRSHTKLRPHYMKVRQSMTAGDYSAAAAKIEQAKKDDIYREDDRVMYWLNLATAQHYARSYDASQDNFVAAEKTIKDLWTTSVSEEIGTIAVSETLSEYGGEDFEKILLYFYTALNKYEQGKVGDALIEARRADEFLKEIQAKYEKDKELSSIYTEDAFMLWLVGLFYEIEGSYNDAYLAYERSYKIYNKDYKRLFGTKPPSFLAMDIVRTGILAGLGSDANSFASRVGVNPSKAQMPQGVAEIILIHGFGEAPYKVERMVAGQTSRNKVFKIALPEYRTDATVVTRSTIRVGTVTVETEMVEPVTDIALKNFEHQKGVLTARALARAAIKMVAAEGSEQIIGGNAGKIVGSLFSVASAVAENADLRTWSLLPGNFRATRVFVPAGPQKVEVAFMNGSGQDMGKRQFDVDLKAGQRRIISVRTVR